MNPVPLARPGENPILSATFLSTRVKNTLYWFVPIMIVAFGIVLFGGKGKRKRR